MSCLSALWGLGRRVWGGLGLHLCCCKAVHSLMLHKKDDTYKGCSGISLFSSSHSLHGERVNFDNVFEEQSPFSQDTIPSGS